MKLHTVIVSYNRRELTEEAITSYLDTVAVPYTLVVADNNSAPDVQDWLNEAAEHYGFTLLQLDKNYYPGYATNCGFELAPPDATHLHRADNDFAFLPGWCERVEAEFVAPTLGQLGLRTDEEEMFAQWNVGGNMIIRRELWDAGLRYDERPWPEYEPRGYTEDSFLSPAVLEMGFRWKRVGAPCIRTLASGDFNDPYYVQTHRDRGLL